MGFLVGLCRHGMDLTTKLWNPMFFSTFNIVGAGTILMLQKKNTTFILGTQIEDKESHK